MSCVRYALSHSTSTMWKSNMFIENREREWCRQPSARAMNLGRNYNCLALTMNETNRHEPPPRVPSVGPAASPVPVSPALVAFSGTGVEAKTTWSVPSGRRGSHALHPRPNPHVGITERTKQNKYAEIAQTRKISQWLKSAHAIIEGNQSKESSQLKYNFK